MLLPGLALVVVGLLVAPAQDGPPPPDAAAADTPGEAAALASPRDAFRTFLESVQAVREGDPGALAGALACIDPAYDTDDPAARRIARDVFEAILHARPIDLEEVPGPEQLAAEDDYYLWFPRPFHAEDEALLGGLDLGAGEIAFERDGEGRWTFAEITEDHAAELAQKLGELGATNRLEEATADATWLRARLPDRLLEPLVLGLAPWQWLGLAALLFLGVVIDHAVRAIARLLVRGALRRVHGEAEDDTIAGLARPLGLFGAGIALLGLVHALTLPADIRVVVVASLQVFTILAGTWAGWTLADLLGEVFLHKAKATASRFDDVLVPLVRKTAKLFLIALGVVYGAQSLDINIVPLITSLGIGGLAFAFAAKDTIENFFGSVAVILDRPFEVGDWIVIDDVEGTVEELGFRSTRVRTFYDSLVTVPNAGLVRATVDNYGRRAYRRWKTTVGLEYSTPPEKLIAFTEGVRELVRGHPHTRKDSFQVWTNDFGASSINVLLYVFFKVPDWATELRERERLLVDVVRLAEHLGVGLAFPTRTVHLARPDRDAEPTEPRTPGPETDARARREGAEGARSLTRDQPWRASPPPAVDLARSPADA